MLGGKLTHYIRSKMDNPVSSTPATVGKLRPRGDMKYFLLLILFQLFIVLHQVSAEVPWKNHLVSDQTPKSVEGLEVIERLGESIDLDVELINENDKRVKLINYVNDKPVFLVMVYYSCPSLCNFHLNGLVQMFKQSQWIPGEEFDFVVVSFESNDDTTLAKEKKETLSKLIL